MPPKSLHSRTRFVRLLRISLRHLSIALKILIFRPAISISCFLRALRREFYYESRVNNGVKRRVIFGQDGNV
jgi:hypothetical protein